MSRCPIDLGLEDVVERCLDCQDCWEKALIEHDTKVIDKLISLYKRELEQVSMEMEDDIPFLDIFTIEKIANDFKKQLKE